jgi:hypothetical protein
MTDPNLMRHQYRELNAIDQARMQEVKDMGLRFVAYLEACGLGRTPNREFALARTKIEEAVMWAVKGITG